MILHAARTEAPDDIVVELRQIQLRLAIDIVAIALTAGGLPATVAIGDHVGLAVIGIDARSHP